MNLHTSACSAWIQLREECKIIGWLGCVMALPGAISLSWRTQQGVRIIDVPWLPLFQSGQRRPGALLYRCEELEILGIDGCRFLYTIVDFASSDATLHVFSIVNSFFRPLYSCDTLRCFFLWRRSYGSVFRWYTVLSWDLRARGLVGWAGRQLLLSFRVVQLFKIRPASLFNLNESLIRGLPAAVECAIAFSVLVGPARSP